MTKKIIYWDDALESYQYGFDLTEFPRKKEFGTDFFKIGFKESYRRETMFFEKHFQENAQKHIEVYIEVLFWKLYSLRERCNDKREFDLNSIDPRIYGIKNSSPSAFWDEIKNFKNNFNNGSYNECKENCRQIAKIMNIKKGMIIPLTFIAFANPDLFPMIDSHVISWINKNLLEQNKNRKNKLEHFNDSLTVETDFNAYIQWVKWSQDSAMILNNNISKYTNWRPRDVEMAIFSYQRQRIGDRLEVLSYRTESEKENLQDWKTDRFNRSSSEEEKLRQLKIEEDNARARKKYLIGKYGDGFTLYELEEFERVFQSNIVDNSEKEKKLFKKIEQEERQLQRELLR
jgi:hypothetical protein